MTSHKITSFKIIYFFGLLANVWPSTSLAHGYLQMEDGLSPPHLKMRHHGWMNSLDHKAIRRGHHVYKQVCATCHSMEFVHFRDLVGVCYTEEEAKEIAQDIEVHDGPDDTGTYFDRPGKITDIFPSPYQNEHEGRYINGGAYPPDLSLITRARHNGALYVFALLTGYRTAPTGLNVRQGLYYNPYFPGGVIAMPKMLTNGSVEFECNTNANEFQMAKDVTSYLIWTSSPEFDARKLLGFKLFTSLFVAFMITAYWKRWLWSPIKTRRII